MNNYYKPGDCTAVKRAAAEGGPSSVSRLPVDAETGKILWNQMTADQLAEFEQFYESFIKALQPEMDLRAEVKALTPFEPAGGLTFDQMIERYSISEILAMKDVPGNAVFDLFEGAMANREKVRNIEPYRPKNLIFPVDKLNSISGPVEYDEKEKLAPVVTCFSLFLDENMPTELSGEITEFDKLLMDAAGTAFLTGHKVVSLPSLFRATGGKGQPSKKQADRIFDALKKLRLITASINNSEEVVSTRYDLFIKKAPLLHFEQITACSKGGVSECFIEIIREPIMFEYARTRKQVSSVPVPVLQAPIRKTEKNLKVQGYLLRRIARKKNSLKKQPEGGRDRKEFVIKMETLYRRTGLISKDATAKRRARNVTEELLSWYASEDAGTWINGFTIDKDSIRIHL